MDGMNSAHNVLPLGHVEELPPSWRWTLLADVVREAQGGFASSVRDPNGIIQIRMNNVTTEGTFDWSTSLRIPRDEAQIRKYALQPQDILFNNTNSVELVGKSALVSELQEPTVYSNHFTRLRLRETAHPSFVAAWLRLLWRSGRFAAICNRWVGQAAVQRDKLLALPFPLPPLAEQCRIAAALDVQMAAVARARTAAEHQATQIERLELRSLASSFGVRPISTRPEQAAPVGWIWSKLTEVTKLESGHTPSRRRPEWWGGDVPWIALPDIRDMDGTFANVTRETTNEAGLANSSARLLPDGTVVLSRTASIGFVTVMGRPMATSQDFVNWVCGPKLLPWFLAYALIVSRDYLHSLASGAVHKTIYMPTLKEFQVCLPSIGEQRRIVDHIEKIRLKVASVRHALSTQRAALDALPAALFRAAFRGEV